MGPITAMFKTVRWSTQPTVPPGDRRSGKKGEEVVPARPCV